MFPQKHEQVEVGDQEPSPHWKLRWWWGRDWSPGSSSIGELLSLNNNSLRSSEDEDSLRQTEDKDSRRPTEGKDSLQPTQDEDIEDEDEGLNNELVMEVKLLKIDELSKVSRDLVNDPQDFCLIILIKVTNLWLIYIYVHKLIFEWIL